tara:strand:- start:2016 stop:2843 length:828 start_codon:yes stop_codon:yes gene_type:complete
MPDLPSAFDLFADRMTRVIYLDLQRYLVAAGLFTIALLVFRGWADRRRIQGRRAKHADYRREFLSSLRTSVVFALTTFLTLWLREMDLVLIKLEVFTPITVIWQTALIIVAHDAYFYWMHRALHHRRLFRTTHLHHHKSRTPTPWAAYSFSTYEAVTEALFIPLFLLATSAAGIAMTGLTVFLFLWHMIFRNVIGHLGVELYPAGWVDNRWTSWWNTTTHHDLHHSSGNSNFGLYFTWWDRWMGTEHPRYKQAFRDVTTRGRAGSTELGTPAIHP